MGVPSRDLGPLLHAYVVAPERPAPLVALGELYPLPLLPIAERPLLHHQLDLLVRQGFRELDVLATDGAIAMRRYLGDGRRWGAEVRLATHIESGAASLSAAPDPGPEPLLTLLWPGELLACVDLGPACDEHLRAGRDVTLLELAGGCEAPSGVRPCLLSPQARRALVSALRQGAELKAALESVSSEGPPASVSLPGRTLVIDSPGALLDANQAALCGELQAEGLGLDPRRCGLQIPFRRHREFFVGVSARLARAKISGASLIGDDAALGEGVKLERSVIGSGTLVDRATEIRDSVVLPGCYVGAELTLDNVIAAPGVLIDRYGNVIHLEPLLLGESPLNGALARLRDIVGAAALLVAGAPLAIPAALTAWRRGGEILERFDCVHPRGGGQEARLRRFAVDWPLARDLPTLLDVLAGRIALVGNPPLTAEEAAKLTEPWQRARFGAPTGLLSLRELEPGAEDDEIQQQILDATYAAERSAALDARILFGSIVSRVRRSLRLGQAG